MPSATTLDDFTDGGARPPDAAAGAASLLAAGGLLSRAVAPFGRLHHPSSNRDGALGERPASLLSGQITTLLASLERHPGATADDHSAARRRIPLRDEEPTQRNGAAAAPRPQTSAPAGSWAVSLALLAADERHASSSSSTESRRAGSRRAHAFSGGLLAGLPAPETSAGGDSPPGGQRFEDRGQRQLETLLRIERLLDEAVRLLRRPRPAVFAADITGAD